jgi:calumenin
MSAVCIECLSKDYQWLPFCCSMIFIKIDKDQDGLVTETELTDWIRHVQMRYVLSDTDRQWKDYVAEANAVHLSWESYMQRTYGHTEGDYSESVAFSAASLL